MKFTDLNKNLQLFPNNEVVFNEKFSLNVQQSLFPQADFPGTEFLGPAHSSSDTDLDTLVKL